MKYRLLIDCSY